MFARVYPIIRLPRKFGVFDYSVPDNVTVNVGDVIRAPFHGRTIFAVVAELSETTEVRGDVSAIIDVYYPQLLDIARIERLAHDIAQSVSTVLYTTYGTFLNETGEPRWLRTSSLRTTSFHKDVVTTIGAALQSRDLHIAVQTSTEGTCLLIQKLRERHTGQILVLCPLEREVDVIATSTALGTHTAALHGKTSPKERERILRAWRNGTLRTLIGTRQASLLEPHALAAIVVTQCGNNEHFNDRRNPRFDARNAASLLAASWNTPLYTCDALPRPEEACASTLVAMPPTNVDIIDLKKIEENSTIPFVATSTLQAINEALQSGKSVLLCFNRKGVAKRAQCKACKTILPCTACGAPWAAQDNATLACPRCRATAALPDACPSCEHGRIALRGVGNVHIEEALAEHFPGVSIARIEKGKTATEARILIATEYYFSGVHRPFSEKRFGLVTDLCVDLSQRADNFRSAEETARKLHRLAFVAQQQGARCIAQTWLATEVEAMRDGASFLRHEITLRTQYGLPPSTAMVTVRHADPEAIIALTGAYFVPNNDVMGSEGRIRYDNLPDALARLSPLPDTAVISVDYHYGNLPGPHQSE